jgi:hypothetical protein
MGRASHQCATAISALVALIVGYLSYGFMQLETATWVPNPADFAKHANLTVQEVPVTYYRPGELKTILGQWDDSPIRVYRLEKGYNFEFDIRDIQSSVGARRINKCDAPVSLICAPCVRPKDPLIDVNVSYVLSQSDLYVMFANISDAMIDKLQGMMSLDWLTASQTEIEHVFLSNFSEPMVSAQYHAAPLVSSLAIQYVGSKSWLFVPSEDFLSSDGMSAGMTPGFLVPRKAPDRQIAVYPYTSQPGDLLFFRESWGHAVYTHEGPNFMMNYRNVRAPNIFRQPIVWFNAIRNVLWYRFGNFNGQPAGSIAAKVVERMGDNLCGPNKISTFDSDLLNVLMDSIKKNKQ